MVFGDVLKNLVENVQGARAAMVMGYDGIPLEQFPQNGTSPIDLATLGVEYCGIINEIKKNSSNLGAQGLQEIVIRADTQTIIIRIINDDYFAILALDSNGYFGKGRFFLRSAVNKVQDQL